MKGDVHFSDYASQPDVHLLCDGSWVTPSVGFVDLCDVYRAESGEVYTFNPAKVSCAECLSRMGPQEELPVVQPPARSALLLLLIVTLLAVLAVVGAVFYVLLRVTGSVQ